jgi:hypothetical protein
MREPKTFDRPRLYYQPAANFRWGRLRILYPDGLAEYDFFSLNQDLCLTEDLWLTSCFQSLSGRKTLQRMREYDKNFEPAWFLGEL